MAFSDPSSDSEHYVSYRAPAAEEILAQEILQPKQWMPDEASKRCLYCNGGFDVLFRKKHHCRACGGLFCATCSSHRALIPLGQCVLPPASDIIRSENELDARTPQRVCVTCFGDLRLLQEELQMTVSRSCVPVNSDRSNFGRFLNLPIQITLQDEIRKAANTLHNFMPDNEIEGGDTIPAELLWGCTGIAFLTVAKGGFLFSGTCGTGLVLAKLPNGTWSAPSAIVLVNVGWGFQIGGEVTDVMLVLNSKEALESFAGAAHFSLGTELGITLGPVGRTAGSDIRAGRGGVASAFVYAHSRGLFAGVSIEAGVVINRPDANEAFYGTPVKVRALLEGHIPPPPGAEVLYRALHELEAQPSPFASRFMTSHWTNRIDYSSGRAAAESSRSAFLAQHGGTRAITGSINTTNRRVSNPSTTEDEVIATAVPIGTDAPRRNSTATTWAVPATKAKTEGLKQGTQSAPPLHDVAEQMRADEALAARLQREEEAAYQRARGLPVVSVLPYKPPRQPNQPTIVSASAVGGGTTRTTGAETAEESLITSPFAVARTPEEDDWSFERRERLRKAKLRSEVLFDEKGFTLPRSNEAKHRPSNDELVTVHVSHAEERTRRGTMPVESDTSVDNSRNSLPLRGPDEIMRLAKTTAPITKAGADEGLFGDHVGNPRNSAPRVASAASTSTAASIIFESPRNALETEQSAIKFRALFGDDQNGEAVEKSSEDDDKKSKEALSTKDVQLLPPRPSSKGKLPKVAAVSGPLFEEDPTLETHDEETPPIVLEALAVADAIATSEAAAAEEDLTSEEIEENPFDLQGMNRSEVLGEVVEDPFSDDESPPQVLNSPSPNSRRDQASDMTTVTV